MPHRFLNEKKFKEDIAERNIKIVLENVADHMDSSVLDHTKLVHAVKRHNPTVISLSFCYTDKSVLNDILRAAGIYTFMIMSQDRASITEGKYVVLDPVQRRIVETFAEEQHKNVFLWGGSGTGKTLLLSQLLSMKVSYYKNMGVRLNVIVCSFASSASGLLLRKFKESYLVHLSASNEVRILDLDELCKGK